MAFLESIVESSIHDFVAVGRVVFDGLIRYLDPMTQFNKGEFVTKSQRYIGPLPPHC